MTLQDLFSQYGVPIGLLIIIVIKVVEIISSLFKAEFKEKEVDSKRDEAITDLALTSNMERRERQTVIDELQKNNNHMQAEIFAIQIALAREEGRRDEMRIANDKNEAKIVTLEVRLQELEKHREQSTQRIKELESQIAILEKQLAAANVDNDILQAQKRELEDLLQKETNRANTLSLLVEKIRMIDGTPTITTSPTVTDSDKTQAIPAPETWDEDAEKTITIPPRKLEDDDGNPTPNAA